MRILCQAGNNAKVITVKNNQIFIVKRAKLCDSHYFHEILFALFIV